MLCPGVIGLKDTTPTPEATFGACSTFEITSAEQKYGSLALVLHSTAAPKKTIKKLELGG